MAVIIGVRFKDGGKVYYFDPGEARPAQDDYVVVETARGTECGRVSLTAREVGENELVRPLRQILRVATPGDIAQLEENRRREGRAFGICQQKIAEHGLEMKLVEVEYSFDGSKILFYFTADGRVDFRELVKDLASVFHTRIELRQIGVRDEAKMLGGLGICGREFCCASFLRDFQPVTIRMAKEQGMSLNPTKISGACGRLMCCLKYEQDAYEDLIKTTPRVNSSVVTPDGRGTVVEANLLTGMLKVRLEGEMSEVRVYHKDELNGGVRRQPSESPTSRPAQRPGRPAPQKQPRRQESALPAAETAPPEEEADDYGDIAQRYESDDAAAPKPRRKHRRGGVRHRKGGAPKSEG